MSVWSSVFGRCSGVRLLAGLLLAFAAQSVQAEGLQALMLRALEIDPSLTEADANIAAAESATESARRQHWPRLGVAAAEPLADRQREFFEDNQFRTVATLNLWSGGGIEAAVKSGEGGERLFRSRAQETRENVAYRVGQLYLEGIRLEQELTLARTNLLRHNSLTRDLGVVAKLDTGRRSDLTQALSRQAQAEARVVTAETSLGIVQSRLQRYSRSPLVRFEPVSFEGLSPQPLPLSVIAEQPEYIAQQAEIERLKAQVDIARARRWPQLDVETSYAEDSQTRLLLNWELANPSTFSDVDGARQQLKAAEARLATVEFDLRERLDTAWVGYAQSARKVAVTEQQIASAQQVVGAFEEQFQIARRSMLDLLNAYAELSGVESASANAQAEVRALALQYLRAAGQTEAWARSSVRVAPAAAATP